MKTNLLPFLIADSAFKKHFSCAFFNSVLSNTYLFVTLFMKWLSAEQIVHSLFGIFEFLIRVSTLLDFPLPGIPRMIIKVFLMYFGSGPVRAWFAWTN